MKYILFLFLFPFAAFSQPKSVAVADFLGAKVAQQPTGPVIYTFERGAPLKRNGYGERSYTALLRAVPAYSDATLGKCVSITVRGKEQGPARYTAKRERPAQVEQASLPIENAEQTDPVRPRKFTGSVQPMPVSDGFGGAGISIPDSMEMVARMEGAKTQIEGWKARAWRTARPVWEFFMYLFSSVFIGLLGLAGLLRYTAKSASEEAFAEIYGTPTLIGTWLVGIHQSFAGSLLIITWACFWVGMINFFQWLVFLDFPLWLTAILWFFALWVAGKVTNWIVPNIKPSGSRSARAAQEANFSQRRLPG